MAGYLEPMAGYLEPMAGYLEPMAGYLEPMAGQARRYGKVRLGYFSLLGLQFSTVKPSKEFHPRENLRHIVW